MSVTVKDRATEDVIAEFAPNDPQAWVFVANSQVQGLGPADLLVEYSITFPTRDMFRDARNGAQDLLGANGYDWDWNSRNNTVTYSWGRRRRR